MHYETGGVGLRVGIVAGALIAVGGVAVTFGLVSTDDGPSDSRPSGQGQIGASTPPLIERRCRLIPSTVTRIRQYECSDSKGNRVIANQIDGEFSTSETEVGSLKNGPDGTQIQDLGNGCKLVIIRRSDSTTADPDVSLYCPK